jgi:hypothetical protein
MKGAAVRTAISPGAELHAESSNSVRAVKAENKPLVESAFISVERYHNYPVFVEHQARYQRCKVESETTPAGVAAAQGERDRSWLLDNEKKKTYRRAISDVASYSVFLVCCLARASRPRSALAFDRTLSAKIHRAARDSILR